MTPVSPPQRAFKSALASDDPREALFRLAERMKKNGAAQAEIYRWFVARQKAIDADHACRAHLDDVLNFIYGGPLADGPVLFPGSGLGAAGCCWG